MTDTKDKDQPHSPPKHKYLDLIHFFGALKDTDWESNKIRMRSFRDDFERRL